MKRCVLLLVMLFILQCTPTKPLHKSHPYTVFYRSIVVIDTAYGSGTGVVVSKNDDTYLVLTASHILNDDTTSNTLVNGLVANVVLMRNRDEDICMLRFYSPDREYDPLEIGTPRLGEEIQLLGFKMGYPQLWRGHVSLYSPRLGVIMFNSGGLPGNSGGQILNDKNEVIGIFKGLSGAWDQVLGTQCIGQCIPTEWEPILESFKSNQ